MADNIDALAAAAVDARNRRKEASKTFGTESAEYKAAIEAEQRAQSAFTEAKQAAQRAAQSTDNSQ